MVWCPLRPPGELRLSRLKNKYRKGRNHETPGILVGLVLGRRHDGSGEMMESSDCAICDSDSNSVSVVFAWMRVRTPTCWAD